LLSFSGAGAADFTVSTRAEFQSALTSAQGNGESDTIHVAAGMYSFSTPLSYTTDDGDGDLTISAVNPADPPRLDGGNVTRILYINTDKDNDQIGDANITITIQNFVVQNGKYASFGGGLLVQTAEADVLIKDCRFSGNTADYTGGAYARATSGSVRLSKNTFFGTVLITAGERRPYPGGSPVINAGICGLHKGHFYIRFTPYDDIDGDKRPGDEQESGCDIGADEYHFSWPMFIPAVTDGEENIKRRF
jgi:hypothetical protein